MAIVDLLQTKGGVWSVNELVQEADELLTAALDATSDVQADLTEGPWPIATDRLKVTAILIALCARARDAMPGGGTVRFETRNVTLSAQYLGNAPETPPGEYVLLSVTNNHARPFDPADIGKARAFALDLGWLPAYMRRLNGMARIFNVEGHGTAVRLYFPAAKPAEGGPTPAPGRRRVLVVDDDEHVRFEVVEQLRSLGYVVMSAYDARSGLEVLRREEPFDLVLSDVVMPWPMGGKELAAEIKKHWAGTAVIFMSGHSEGTILKHELLEAGAAWLAKPFRKADLARAVAQALGRGDLLTEY